MSRSLNRRRRAEGMTEYIIITSMLMVCAVVGLFRSLSTAADHLANTKALCAECPKLELTEFEADELEKLREKKRTTGLDDAEKARFEELEGRAGAADDDGTVNSDSGASKPTSAFDRWLDSLFGAGWRSDSFLGSFLGLFGWFGFA